MRYHKEDEFHFDPDLEFTDKSKEHDYAPEYTDKCPEYQLPPVYRTEKRGAAAVAVKRADEDAAREEKKHQLLKKLLFIPVASVVAAVSVIFASMNIDLLGTDFLMSSVSPSTPSTPGSSSVSGFPTLPNLDPDFAGKYAWSGYGSEEYICIDGAYILAGTVYTDMASFQLKTVDGASYDKTKNTLTLTNFTGSYIDTNLMGNGFKIELVGDNYIDYIRIWGAMYGGSVTFTGSGTLKLNSYGKSPLGAGLWLECEQSPSAVMIDKDATVEVYGSKAIIITQTTLPTAIYMRSPVTVTGGECGSGDFMSYSVYAKDASGNVIYDENGNPQIVEGTIKDISKEAGMDLYDYSVLDENGQPATAVIFKPAS